LNSNVCYLKPITASMSNTAATYLNLRKYL